MSRKKNVSKLISCALVYVDAEVHLLQYNTNDNPNIIKKIELKSQSFWDSLPQSPLFLDTGNTRADGMEDMLSLYLLSAVKNKKGNIAYFNELVYGYQWLFNFSYNGDERNWKRKLLERQLGKTKFLDSRRDILLEHIEITLSTEEKEKK